MAATGTATSTATATEHWCADLLRARARANLPAAARTHENLPAAAASYRIPLHFNHGPARELVWAVRAERGFLFPARPSLSVAIPDALLRRMCCDGYWFAVEEFYWHGDTTYHASPLCADIHNFGHVEVHTAADVATAMEAAAAKGTFIRRCMCVSNHRSVREAGHLRLRCDRDAAAAAFFEQRLPNVVFTTTAAPNEHHASLACFGDGDSVHARARRVRRPHMPGHCCAWDRRRAWAAACVHAAARRSPPQTEPLEQLLTDRRLCRATGPRITSFIAGYVLSNL
jgi:hypothetical protein